MRRKRVWENQMSLRAYGLQVPVTGVSYLCPATHAPYQGPHEATVPVRVWPRPLKNTRHPRYLQAGSAPHWESGGLTLLIVFF